MFACLLNACGAQISHVRCEHSNGQFKQDRVRVCQHKTTENAETSGCVWGVFWCVHSSCRPTYCFGHGWPGGRKTLDAQRIKGCTSMRFTTESPVATLFCVHVCVCIGNGKTRSWTRQLQFVGKKLGSQIVWNSSVARCVTRRANTSHPPYHEAHNSNKRAPRLVPTWQQQRSECFCMYPGSRYDSSFMSSYNAR